jgi:hypothetical protein
MRGRVTELHGDTGRGTIVAENDDAFLLLPANCISPVRQNMDVTFTPNENLRGDLTALNIRPGVVIERECLEVLTFNPHNGLGKAKGPNGVADFGVSVSSPVAAFLAPGRQIWAHVSRAIASEIEALRPDAFAIEA